MLKSKNCNDICENSRPKKVTMMTKSLVVPTTKTRTPSDESWSWPIRLPIRARRDARTARWTFDTAPGGLATALRGIATDVEFVWVGWLGADVPPAERTSRRGATHEGARLLPRVPGCAVGRQILQWLL